jgi:hypothetical protein
MADGDIYVYRDTADENGIYGWLWLDGAWQDATPSYTTHSFGETIYVLSLDGEKPSWLKESTHNKHSRQMRKGKARAN